MTVIGRPGDPSGGFRFPVPAPGMKWAGFRYPDPAPGGRRGRISPWWSWRFLHNYIFMLQKSTVIHCQKKAWIPCNFNGIALRNDIKQSTLVQMKSRLITCVIKGLYYYTGDKIIKRAKMQWIGMFIETVMDGE